MGGAFGGPPKTEKKKPEPDCPAKGLVCGSKDCYGNAVPANLKLARAHERERQASMSTSASYELLAMMPCPAISTQEAHGIIGTAFASGLPRGRALVREYSTYHSSVKTPYF